jgi:NADPH2:quinone reductase
MKAVVNTAPGGPEVLALQDRPRPEPGVGQIRVRVAASALNRADLMQRAGRYPAPPGASHDVPGLEYAGTVDALGPDTRLWASGARVMGLVGGGAHAEFVCVNEREAMTVPDGLSLDQAAAIPEAFLTAYDALLTRLDVRAGERVLVHAVGSGVGTAALQLARVAGATVIGTSRSPAKLARATAMGLAHAIDASDGEWAQRVEAAIGTDAVHAIVDLVGGDYLGGNLRVLSTRGRLVVVGLTAGRRTTLDLGLLLSKRVAMVGTMLRSRPLEEKITLARDFAERMVPLFASGALAPVVDRVMPFAEIRAAHELMASDGTFGKVVLRWS